MTEKDELVQAKQAELIRAEEIIRKERQLVQAKDRELAKLRQRVSSWCVCLRACMGVCVHAWVCACVNALCLTSFDVLQQSKKTFPLWFDGQNSASLSVLFLFIVLLPFFVAFQMKNNIIQSTSIFAHKVSCYICAIRSL